MDKFETASDYSFHSDSLLSNASSLSGLSCYENEFAELRHLVNPAKYSTPLLDRCVTPKAYNETEESKETLIKLQNELQRSIELNTKYKNELANVERKIEIKFHDKIEQLIRNNAKLGGQLQNANNQIQRLIKNYNDKNEYVVLKEKIDLEKRVQEVSYENIKLENVCAIIKHETENSNLENKTLKISLNEYVTELDINKGTIENLKAKISEQHVQIQISLKENIALNEKLNALSAKLESSEKSNNWYKDQLQLSHHDKQNFSEQIIKYKSEINDLNENVSQLNIMLSKFKSEIDEVRFQALKEKEALFAKLETIKINLEVPSKIPKPTLDEVNSTAYSSNIEDLHSEITRLKYHLENREREFNVFKKENSSLLSKYLVLQKNYQQAENNIEQLENAKKEFYKELEFLKESLKEKQADNLKLKNEVLALGVEFKRQDQEKKSVESTIELIRSQFLKIQNHFKKVKGDLNQKNKEVLELQNDRQQLFMQNNWTKCELEKETKEKDATIENLRMKNSNLKENLAEQIKLTTDLRFQILKLEKIVEEGQSIINDKKKELENYDIVLSQYKNMHCDYETKINLLQNNLHLLEDSESELRDNLNSIKNELKENNFKMESLKEENKQIKLENKKSLEQAIADGKDAVLHSCKDLEKEYTIKLDVKEKLIQNLQFKYKKFEADYAAYLKRNTDDHKVELKNMLNNDNFFNIVFDKLNVDELENVVNIRLKHIEERIRAVYNQCEDIRQKVNDKDDKVKKLELLLQVKEREMQDKRKKMDRNNRTLLRKLKEHMRGRNSAEKHLKYIQDLYDSLSNNYNALMLSVTDKDYSLKSLQELCDQYKENYIKSKQIISSLERKLSELKECTRCFDYDIVKNKFAVVKEVSDQLQVNNKNLQNQCKDSKETIKVLNNKLQEKNMEINQHIINIEAYKRSASEFEEKENEFKVHYDNLVELTNRYEYKESLCIKNQACIETLNQQLVKVNENNDFLTLQIKDLSSNLQQKVEYLTKMEESKSSMETRLVKEIAEHQSLLLQLKKKALILQNENENLKGDKFFLQRLSNDLKIALKSYADYNKVLQEQLNVYSSDIPKTPNLPTINDLSLAGKYDETYINRLLTENKKPSLQKPVTSEIQGCLQKLKEEIFNLQDEIARKNSQVQ